MKSMMDRLGHCSQMYPNITLVKAFSTDEITINGMGKVTPCYRKIQIIEIDGIDVSNDAFHLNYNYAHDSIEFFRSIKFRGENTSTATSAIVYLAD